MDNQITELPLEKPSEKTPSMNGEQVSTDQQQSNTPSRETPNISVIVPVYNSSEFLKRCLHGISQSDYSNYEVIVIDDGSIEPIAPIVEKYGYRYERIEGPGGPARARNHGARIVNGSHLVFVDADVIVQPDVLSRFAAAFESDPQLAGIIGSYDESPAEPNFLSQYKNLFHHYVHQNSDGPVNTFWSGCGAMQRELFLEFGGFDETRYRRPAIEDIELGTWMSAFGHRIILDSAIKAKHLKRWTLWGLCKTDIFDRGVPWTRLMLRAGAMASTLNVKPTQRVSVALSGLTLLSLILSFWFPLSLVLTVGLFLTVTFLNFDFYRFFADRSGLLFALRVVPLHWLYFWYCGFSVIWGTILHYIEGPTRKAPAPSEFN